MACNIKEGNTIDNYEYTVGGLFLDLSGKPVFTEKVYPDFYADLKKCLEA